MARAALKESLWIVVGWSLFPSIWFFPLHNKKPCWLPSLPGVWCLSFPHSTAVLGRFAEYSDFGLELALACLNILLITTEWWCIQISSILRGQVPFQKKNPTLKVHVRGICNNIKLNGNANSGQGQIQTKGLTLISLIPAMDWKGHKCDLRPSLTVGNYAEVGRYLCWIQFSLGADLETAVGDLLYR